MGTVFTRYKSMRWYIQYRDATGKWRHDPTDYYGPEHRDDAVRVLDAVERRVAAGVEAGEREGALTFERYVEKWEKTRVGLADYANDHQRLRDYATPVFGKLRLDQIRPRHVLEVIQRLKTEGKASKTIHNTYSAMRAVFRDAAISDLIESSPCILGRAHMPPVRDKVQGWRTMAVYTHEEVETLISDERVPWDRRVVYALEGVAGLRHGEAAGVRWCDYDPSIKPLGRITVARSYTKGTKTGRTRYVPTHPTLAAILAEWKLRGWEEMMGRPPEPDDLIAPCPERPQFRAGRMRGKDYSRKMLMRDFKALGLRHRRGHDLRRTFISLARTDGARRDLLELVTHTPKSDAAIEAYTTIDWPPLCAEVRKLNIRRVNKPSESAVR